MDTEVYNLEFLTVMKTKTPLFDLASRASRTCGKVKISTMGAARRPSETSVLNLLRESTNNKGRAEFPPHALKDNGLAPVTGSLSATDPD